MHWYDTGNIHIASRDENFVGQSCKKHLEAKWHYQYKATEAHFTLLLRQNEID
jgi:hypothetical protein